jgi:hypothetical protein
MIALAWGILVESALLTDRLVQDMKEVAASKHCPCNKEGWLPYFLPEPPPEAREAFNQYVACRWPIHVFSLDPVTDQQNIASLSLQRREMQLALSLAFVSGQISTRTMMNYARRIERDMMTIDLNNTAVGFAHGTDTFGWRFYPRFQTPDIESNGVVLFRDLIVGGPSRDSDLRHRLLEPGTRECVAIVLMPSFVPYATVDVSSNWFCLTHPKYKLMDLKDAMKLSRSVTTIKKCGPDVLDADCYRDGDLRRLMEKAKQLEARLPLQTMTVQVPYENTLGGFAMFNTGITDLAPNLTGWYGASSINVKKATTLFLVGDHFSVHQTRVVAGGVEVTSPELMSRQVMKVTIPAGAGVLKTRDGDFVDVQLATPYGVTPHLLIPVCAEEATQAQGTSWSPATLKLGYTVDGKSNPKGYKLVKLPDTPKELTISIDTEVPPATARADVMIKFPPNFQPAPPPIMLANLAIKGNKITIPVDLIAAAAFNVQGNVKPPISPQTLGPTFLALRDQYGHPLHVERTTSNYLTITWTQTGTPAASGGPDAGPQPAPLAPTVTGPPAGVADIQRTALRAEKR